MRIHKTISYFCSFCGKKQEHGRKYPNGWCQGCYKYFHSGGKVNPLPERGVIAHDDLGNVVCHICGRAYKRLGSHIKESHEMTISEYKEKFGLCANSKTTEYNYSQVMHKHAIDNNMPQRLLIAGYNTRIQPGDTHLRKDKKIRLQESIDKRNRNKYK